MVFWLKPFVKATVLIATVLVCDDVLVISMSFQVGNIFINKFVTRSFLKISSKSVNLIKKNPVQQSQAVNLHSFTALPRNIHGLTSLCEEPQANFFYQISMLIDFE